MATPTKSLNGVIYIFGLVSFLISVNFALGETKVFIEEYTYQASEYDSKVSCRVLALEQVKRLLLEKLGTYLESETEVKNFQLTKDQIVILTAGIVRAEIIEEKWDGKTYYLKAKIVADLKDVANSMEKLRRDHKKTKELEETRKKAEGASKEVERLKTELKKAKADKTKVSQYNEAVDKLSATDWVEKGYLLGYDGKWQEAREAFTRAVQLDPNYAQAYSDRASTYINLGNYRQALSDYDKAVELDSKFVAAHHGRGLSYELLGEHQKAISNFNRAIELDPRHASSYNSRGSLYNSLGDYQQGIRDLDRAIELDPQNWGYYYNRGLGYDKLGNHRQAIKDFNRSIELAPWFTEAYYARGIAH